MGPARAGFSRNARDVTKLTNGTPMTDGTCSQGPGRAMGNGADGGVKNRRIAQARKRPRLFSPVKANPSNTIV